MLTALITGQEFIADFPVEISEKDKLTNLHLLFFYFNASTVHLLLFCTISNAAVGNTNSCI